MENNLNNPFGVLEFLHWNHSWNNYKYPGEAQLKKSILSMKKAGVGWIRMDFLWSDIEPARDKFDFDKYDLIVKLIKDSKMQVLGVLQYSTDWASDCGCWNCPPKDNQDFLNYAGQVIRRYRGQIQYWEVWNEPDSSVYWAPQDGLKTYCLLLKDVYLLTKEICPECKILNGGLANGLASVNQLYDSGGGGYFDILNLHFFQSPLNGKGAIKSVTAYPKLAYKIMRRHGDADKKIWITEIGCPGVSRGIKTGDWWMGKNPDERRQSRWLKEVYTGLLKEAQVEKIFWAFFRDTKKHWDNGVDYFGLVRWDNSVKPAWKAYRKCYQEWEKESCK
jgi:hypothetical protein